MDFERDDQEHVWKKENPKRDERFDFAPFLGPDSLNDRVTAAADGQDVLDDEAFGDFSSVVQKVPFDGRHGRHLSPRDRQAMDEEDQKEQEEPKREPAERSEQMPEEDWLAEEEDTAAHDAYEDKAPPRPKIIVAEPTPEVYIDPRENGYDRHDEPPQGLSGGQKAIAVFVVLAALVIVALAVVFLVRGSKGRDDAAATPTPPLTAALESRETSTPPPMATATPVPATPAGAAFYTVTVTNGSGGSVSPSGNVQVDAGKNITFLIQPDPNFEIAQMLVDGASVAVMNSYTFTNMQDNHTLSVVFQALPETPPPAEPTAEPTPEPTAEPTPEPTPEPTTEPKPELPPAPDSEPEPDPGLPPEGGESVPQAEEEENGQSA